MSQRGNGQRKMIIVNYTSQTALVLATNNPDYCRCQILDNDFSISFRLFDHFGNTLELHIFYK